MAALDDCLLNLVEDDKYIYNEAINSISIRGAGTKKKKSLSGVP